MPGRIEIDDVQPAVSGGRFPAKAVVGEVVPVRATVWREGHDAVAATLVVRHHGTAYPQLVAGPSPPEPEPVPIEALVSPSVAGQTAAAADVRGPYPDMFHGQFVPDAVGLWTFRVDGWGDPIATWRKAVIAKLDAGQTETELSNDLLIGAKLLERAATGCRGTVARRCSMRPPGCALPANRRSRAGAALTPEITDLLSEYPLRELVTRGEQYGVWVDRPVARFAAWYELFPRSTGGRDADGVPVHGTFATAAKALPRVAKMGFDVVYLPPDPPDRRGTPQGPQQHRDRRAG